MSKKLLIIYIFLLCKFNILSALSQGASSDFKIVVPNNNWRVEAGEKITVKWMNYSYTAKNITRLNIYLIDNNTSLYTLAKNILNSGEFTVTVPLNFKPGDYKIKIVSVDNFCFGLSENFRIIAPIPIKIIQPTSESVWKVGLPCIIKWHAPYPESKVYIDLLKFENYGQLTSRLKISDGIKNKGEYTWSIPKFLEEGKYLIKIRIPPIGEAKHSETFLIRR